MRSSQPGSDQMMFHCVLPSIWLSLLALTTSAARLSNHTSNNSLPECEQITLATNENEVPPCSGGPLDLRLYNITPFCAKVRMDVYGAVTAEQKACFEATPESTKIGCQWAKDFATWTRGNKKWMGMYGATYLENLIDYYTAVVCEVKHNCEYSRKFMLANVMVINYYWGFHWFNNPVISGPGTGLSPPSEISIGLLPQTIRFSGLAVQYLGFAWFTLVGNLFNARVLWLMLRKIEGPTFVFHLADVSTDILVSLGAVLRFAWSGFVPAQCTETGLYYVTFGFTRSLGSLSLVYQTLLLMERFVAIVLIPAPKYYTKYVTRKSATCFVVVVGVFILGCGIGAAYSNALAVATNVPANITGVVLYVVQLVLIIVIAVRLRRHGKVQHRVFREYSDQQSAYLASVVPLMVGTLLINILTTWTTVIFSMVEQVSISLGIKYNYKQFNIASVTWSLQHLQPWLEMLNGSGFLLHVVLSRTYREAAREAVLPLRELFAVCCRKHQVLPIINSKQVRVTAETAFPRSVVRRGT